MASGKLRGVIERSIRNFARHDMQVYATALAYRGLFALFPFAIFLVAVVSFLRVDAVLGWLAEQGPSGIRGNVPQPVDRKSTRLNSSHANISYAVFCLKKKKKNVTAVDARLQN